MVRLPIVCDPPRLISGAMPPGLYLASSESSSPPPVESKMPRSRPSTVQLIDHVSCRVGCGAGGIHASSWWWSGSGGGERAGGGDRRAGQRAVGRDLDDLDLHPFGARRAAQVDRGVQLAIGERLVGVDGAAGVDVERLLRRLAVQRAGVVVAEAHAAQGGLEAGDDLAAPVDLLEHVVLGDRLGL